MATAAAVIPKPDSPSLVTKFAAKFGVDPAKMIATLKATAFKQSGDAEISNEQMMALLIVADQYGLNPWTRELYAFADRSRGVVPIVSVDGWARIINDDEQFDGVSFEYGPELDDRKQAPAWIECTIHRKDRTHPTTVREKMSECYRDTGPWNSHPARMLRHKALIQCGRLAFGFSGIYDEDEAQRIIEGTVTRVEESPAIAKINQEISPPKANDRKEHPPLTYAQLMDMFKKAHEKRDLDLLDAHCTLVNELPEEQRADAITEYKRIRDELQP